MTGEPIITIVGNLTGDPGLRYVSSGTSVASFTAASAPCTLSCQTQQWEDGEVVFIRCSVWREYGKNVTESLSKGMRVFVTGWLIVRSYEYSGQQRTSLKIQVDGTGSSLQYARVQVTKVAGGGSGNGNFGGDSSCQGSGDYDGGHASYDAPQDGSAHDPWSSTPQNGSASDDNSPF